MTQGIQIEIRSDALRPSRSGQFLSGAAALCLYAALWGSLWDMAAGSLPALLPLTAGAVLTAALALAPGGARRRRLALAAGALAVLLVLLRPALFLDGCKLLLNRLFAESEARQAYTYQMFPVSSAPGAVAAALLPLGLFTGALLGSRRRVWAVAAFTALCAGAAYLGLSPRLPWSALLALAMALCFLDPLPRPAAGAILACLALVCAVAVLALPGEDPALSAWEEAARDRLAVQTVAYVERPAAAPTPTPPQEEPDLTLLENVGTPGALGGFELTWSRPLSALLVILAFALALFLPAILNDRLKKRRARNRAWMEEENVPAAVRSGFLYALRWLKLGGLAPANVPFSGYLQAVEERFSPTLAGSYAAALPLWQEAAYSSHPMAPEQRERMRAFAWEAQQAVWDGLDRRGRFLAKYIYAL